MTTRRRVLQSIGAGVAGVLAGHRFAFATADTDARLVVLLLRGGMDGLSAVPAFGDPDFEGARAGLAMAPESVLKLDDTFGLHPNLKGLAELFRRRELAVVHAVATPYRERSHFDGQNLLENGSEAPFGMQSGWLNRAIALLPSVNRPLGVALDSNMPLVLRGAAPVSSWSPSLLPAPRADTMQRLAALYAETDPALAQSFARAQGANALARQGAAAGRAFGALMSAAARFLVAPEGTRIAVAEIGGWDTHVNQAGARGALANNLATLDRGIETLRTELGSVWTNTMLIAVSEFGRTVAQNGTGGTDHGVGGAMFLAGGALRGGRVIADWPGLKPANLYKQRDLAATTDFRSVALGVLRDHLRIDEARLASVFPSDRAVRPLGGLARTA